MLRFIWGESAGNRIGGVDEEQRIVECKQAIVGEWMHNLRSGIAGVRATIGMVLGLGSF